MNMRKLIFVLVAALLLVGCAQEEQTPLADTFYATILEIDGDILLVEGMEVNDINTRGQFYIQVDENTQLDWLGTEITLSDLQAGDTIAITWSGLVQETYPARIVDPVHRIKLLDDEK